MKDVVAEITNTLIVAAWSVGHKRTTNRRFHYARHGAVLANENDRLHRTKRAAYSRRNTHLAVCLEPRVFDDRFLALPVVAALGRVRSRRFFGRFAAGWVRGFAA